MRTSDEVAEVLDLARRGHNRSHIARRTGIPRSTVRDWLEGRTPRASSLALTRPPSPPAAPYGLLLGLYLGDGHVVRLGRTYMLRIFFDARYPGLIGEAFKTVRAVVPDRRVSVFRRKPTNCVVVRCYWGGWPTLLPQHGPGVKHDRRIVLSGWQRRITHRHPREFIRGLLVSDGTRVTNHVRHGNRWYSYPRYQFSNRSENIKGLLCEHLDLLGIAWRRAGALNISIARRDAVAALDKFVGPKT